MSSKEKVIIYKLATFFIFSENYIYDIASNHVYSKYKILEAMGKAIK